MQISAPAPMVPGSFRPRANVICKHAFIHWRMEWTLLYKFVVNVMYKRDYHELKNIEYRS